MCSFLYVFNAATQFAVELKKRRLKRLKTNDQTNKREQTIKKAAKNEMKLDNDFLRQNAQVRTAINIDVRRYWTFRRFYGKSSLDVRTKISSQVKKHSHSRDLPFDIS